MIVEVKERGITAGFLPEVKSVLENITASTYADDKNKIES